MFCYYTISNNIKVKGVKYFLNCVRGTWDYVYFSRELSKFLRGMIK